MPAATANVSPPWSLNPLILLNVTRRCLAQPSFVYVVSCLFCLFSYIVDTRLVQVLFSLPLHITCCSSNTVDAVYGCVYGHVIGNLPYSKVTSLLFVQLFAALW